MGAGILLGTVRTEDLLAVVVAADREWTGAAVETIGTPWGAIRRSDRHPLIHVANHAWVDRMPEGGPPEILEAMDRAFAGTSVPHRSVVFRDAHEAFDAQDAFVALGFRPKADVAMARLGLPSCIVNPDVEVREARGGAAEDAFARIAAAINEESGYSAEVGRQMADLDRERRTLVGTRIYVSYLEGRPAGTVSLRTRPPHALIEDVATHPDFRMKGVGRTTIFEACNLAIRAGAEWILLTADYFDTPKLMYKTLGFEPVGEIRGFLRE